jgi:hypothetical protein
MGCEYGPANGHLCGRPTKWWIPLTEENLCHDHRDALVAVLTESERKKLNDAPASTKERDEYRDSFFRRTSGKADFK